MYNCLEWFMQLKTDQHFSPTHRANMDGARSPPLLILLANRRISSETSNGSPPESRLWEGEAVAKYSKSGPSRFPCMTCTSVTPIPISPMHQQHSWLHWRHCHPFRKGPIQADYERLLARFQPAALLLRARSQNLANSSVHPNSIWTLPVKSRS